MKRKNTNKYVSFALVIAAYAIMMILTASGKITRSMQGMLVPICAYIVMAISLNLTVGILGELSLGHAGFMSMGAFTGTCAALMMTDAVPNAGLRLGIFSLFTLSFCHEHADRFADFVHFSSGCVFLLLCRFAFGIQTKYFVNCFCGTGEVFFLQSGDDVRFIVVDLFECKHKKYIRLLRFQNKSPTECRSSR